GCCRPRGIWRRAEAATGGRNSGQGAGGGDDGGGGEARGERDALDAAAGGEDFGFAHDLTRAPVGALDQDVGEERGDHFLGRGLIEEHDVIHAFERGQDLGALLLGDDRTAGAFAAADAGVGVDGDEEDVAEEAGSLQRLQVAGVEEIVAAVGQDQVEAGAAEAVALGGEGAPVAEDHADSAPAAWAVRRSSTAASSRPRTLIWTPAILWRRARIISLASSRPSRLPASPVLAARMRSSTAGGTWTRSSFCMNSAWRRLVRGQMPAMRGTRCEAVSARKRSISSRSKTGWVTT